MNTITFAGKTIHINICDIKKSHRYRATFPPQVIADIITKVMEGETWGRVSDDLTETDYGFTVLA